MWSGPIPKCGGKHNGQCKIQFHRNYALETITGNSLFYQDSCNLKISFSVIL